MQDPGNSSTRRWPLSLARQAGAALLIALLVATCREATNPPTTATLDCGQPATLDAGPDVRSYLGQPVKVVARVSQSGTKGCWLLQWGDGVADTGTFSSTATQISVTHKYNNAGKYAIRLSGVGATNSGPSDTVAAVVDMPGTPQVLIGGGDIVECALKHAENSAKILDTIPGTVFTAGDNAYPNGSLADYNGCYAATWGRHKGRTYPAPGNHDWIRHDSSGYFGYYGVAAGDPALGYYSYDLGAWHIISLNSNIARAAGSAQEKWLRADLAASDKKCTLAYWHHPRFSSGETHGNDSTVQALWQALYDAGAEVIVSAHEHNYERFAPQTPTGVADPQRGIREFVAGASGGGYYPFGTILPNSQAQSIEHGLVKFTLSDGSYRWDFIPTAGYTFKDSGTGTCH